MASPRRSKASPKTCQRAARRHPTAPPRRPIVLLKSVGRNRYARDGFTTTCGTCRRASVRCRKRLPSCDQGCLNKHPIVQHRRNDVGLDGPAEEVSLSAVATQRDEPATLSRGLDALGDSDES